MDLPDLSRIVEAHVPVEAVDFNGYLEQLRRDVQPHIRSLQSAKCLRWFSFLLHPAKQLKGFGPDDESLVIHLRLEPVPELDAGDLIGMLPPHFRNPVLRPLGGIDGLDGSLLREDNWAHAWRLVGESAEYVLCALEGHAAAVPPQQLGQFLHYITNALGLGWQFGHVPKDRRF